MLVNNDNLREMQFFKMSLFWVWISKSNKALECIGIFKCNINIDD